MSEEKANYIRDQRAARHDALRRLVVTGNLMAHALDETASQQERELLAAWEKCLAELRGSLESRS